MLQTEATVGQQLQASGAESTADWASKPSRRQLIINIIKRCRDNPRRVLATDWLLAKSV